MGSWTSSAFVHCESLSIKVQNANLQHFFGLLKKNRKPDARQIVLPQRWILLQVTAFSRWEKELPKLIADLRFKAIANMKDRKAAFEGFCKSTVEQRRKLKQEVGLDSQNQPSSSKEAQSDFKGLLQEAATKAETVELSGTPLCSCQHLRVHISLQSSCCAICIVMFPWACHDSSLKYLWSRRSAYSVVYSITSSRPGFEHRPVSIFCLEPN